MSRFSAESVDLFLDESQCRVVRGESVMPHALPAGEMIWPEALLSEMTPRSRVRAVIADARLRYLVCQWPKTLRGRLEREAWLAHQFRQVHDIDPAQWQVMADADAIGAPFIACAMPRTIEAQLRVLLDRVGARLTSLTGAFIHRYNACCHDIDAPDGAFAVLEGTRATLATWQAGRWGRIANRPLAAEDHGALARELAQLRVTGEIAGQGCLYVVGAAAEAPSGWTVTRLEGR